jgi:hypothetical protein
MEKKLNLIYGIIGCLGLIFLSHPILEQFRFFGGSFGFLLNDLFRIISAVGLYSMGYFSILLVINTYRSLAKNKNKD